MTGAAGYGIDVGHSDSMNAAAVGAVAGCGGSCGLAVGGRGGRLARGSWLSAVRGVVVVLLMLRRTILEDSFLRQDLAGYTEYAAEVRFRLIPGVW